MPRSIHSQAMQGRESFTDGCAPLLEVTVVAPAGNSKITAPHGTFDPTIIQPPYGLRCLFEIGRKSSSISEQVYYLHGTIAPVPGKSDTAADGGIVPQVIGGRRIQAYEQYAAPVFRPAAM